MATALMLLVALFFLGMGGYGLVAPASLVRPFGIEVADAKARAEVRAVYGGFGVAVAALLAYAAFAGGTLRQGVALTVAVALLGMAFGRLAARTVERQPGFYPSWLYFVVELVLAGLLLVAFLA